MGFSPNLSQKRMAMKDLEYSDAFPNEVTPRTYVGSSKPCQFRITIVMVEMADERWLFVYGSFRLFRLCYNPLLCNNQALVCFILL
jgi:hypothetical protein